ncbi:DUF502 domain-containing protein [Tepidiphilus thermophilus]|uniref:Uncharacterized membrane protein n=1 Tax=Tepidiphilus thermophilus TaxID=876478 RepID=A0A0K6IWT5_9PROT|nr:DUF502 domain-containing protein [Tepidiphilus thermophilus]CUB07524.1 Uncharacterized membrane protein [Tepidiphilus thermophilus]
MRRYFVTGLLVWLPIVVTFAVLAWIVGTLDALIDWLPERWRPETLLGYRIPGLGVVAAVSLVFATGIVAANVLGQRLIELWEALIRRIPIVKSLYSSVKQVSETLFSEGGQAFRTAVLVEYPRRGAWTVAFVTGEPPAAVVGGTGVAEPMIAVYVPTTPNPTSGFLLLVPESEIIPLELGIDEALKYVISLGTITPTAMPPSIHSPDAGT